MMMPAAKLAELRAELAELRKQADARLPTPAHPSRESAGTELGRWLASRYDELLAPLFAPLDATQAAFAAVGGYGRGCLARCSDVDVRILAHDAEVATAVVDDVLYPLWDAGFAVGHQILLTREVLDVAREDLATATSLLDYRHLAGDRAMSEELLWRAKGSLFSTSELSRFYDRLLTDSAKRHERYGDSVYLLEPDVKNGAGGLRDLDVFRWVGAARWGSGELEALVRVGAIVPREAAELALAQEMLWCLRNLLHAHAGRRSDRLTFEEQESAAVLLGYGEGGEAVERLMSDYYVAARAISRGVTMLLARATPTERRRPKDEDLGEGFLLHNGELTLADASLLEREPATALRLVALAVERHVPLYPWIRDAIMRSAADAAWCERLRESKLARRLFVELVASRRETRLACGSALRELHELGLLLAMVPEFSPVVGRVHHDTYHVYTVDVHSVAAVDRLAALARGELTASHALASRLATEVARPATLAFATLLHDVGKAIGGKDHSQRGAVMARAILERLELRSEDVAEACLLIHEHLTMYRLATRRDVDDPSTIDEMIASVMGGRETLRNLFLLTVVDVSTTSPTSMTSWKAQMLDELYLATDATLSGAGEAPRAEAARDSVRARGAELWRGPARAAQLEFLERYLASMPDRYALANSEDSVLAHAELARAHAAHAPRVTLGLVPSSHAEAAELCIVTDDRPGLLALIAQALGASRLEVHAAHVYSRTREGGGVEAVDLFWVRDRTEGVAAVPGALPRLERDLELLLSGEASRDSVKLRVVGTRSGPPVPTRVTIDHRASPSHTVIEVATHDRPGVLWAISRCLYELGLSIAIAKIATEGARVADVFYVSEPDGSKVAPGPRAAEVAARLEAALGVPTQGTVQGEVKA